MKYASYFSVILTCFLIIFNLVSCKAFSKKSLNGNASYDEYQLNTLTDQTYLFGIQQSSHNKQLYEFIVCLSSEEAGADISQKRCVNAYRTINNDNFYIPEHLILNADFSDDILKHHKHIGYAKSASAIAAGAGAGFYGIKLAREILETGIHVIGFAALVVMGVVLFVPREKVNKVTEGLDVNRFAIDLARSGANTFSSIKVFSTDAAGFINKPEETRSLMASKAYINIWGTSQSSVAHYWQDIMNPNFSEIDAKSIVTPIPAMLPKLAQVLIEMDWADSSQLKMHCLPFVPNSDPWAVHQGCKKLGENWDLGNAFFSYSDR